MENQMTVNPSLKTNPMAIASLVLSASGISFLPLIGSIAGIITANIALNEIREKPDLYSGESLAKVGRAFGWVGIILSCLVVILIGMLLLPIPWYGPTSPYP